MYVRGCRQYTCDWHNADLIWERMK